MENKVWGEGRHVKAKMTFGYSNLKDFDGEKITSLDLIISQDAIEFREDIEDIITSLRLLSWSLEPKYSTERKTRMKSNQ